MDNSKEITVKDLVFQKHGLDCRHSCKLCCLDRDNCNEYLTQDGVRINKLCVDNDGYYDLNKKKKHELNGGIPERWK